MRRLLVALGLTAAAVLAIASAQAPQRNAVDWRGERTVVTRSGIRISYPRSWHALEAEGTVFVASFPISRAWTTQEHKRVPDGGVYMQIFTYGWLPPSYGFPPRPRHFELLARDHGFYECGFGLEGYALRFRERGLAVQAMVALGDGDYADDATAVLDRLTVTGIRPGLARA